MVFLKRLRERAAARWLARMGNEGAAFDRAAFERWRKKLANARAFDEAATSWGQPLPIAATRYAGAQSDRDYDSTSPRWPTRTSLAVAAAALLALIVGVGHRQIDLVTSPESPQPAHHAAQVETATDTVRTIRLSDGSIAKLEGGSLLAVAFSEGVRNLTLLRGHARFDVAHDAARPFQVRAGQSLIIAHGTVFDVRFITQDVRVVLLRGAIDVVRLEGATQTKDIRKLQPGESVTVSASGPISQVRPIAEASVSDESAMLSFNSTALNEAIASFNRRNDRQIALHADALRGETVSGAFAAKDPDGFAQMLASMFSLILERRANGDLVLAAKP